MPKLFLVVAESDADVTVHRGTWVVTDVNEYEAADADADAVAEQILAPALAALRQKLKAKPTPNGQLYTWEVRWYAKETSA